MGLTNYQVKDVNELKVWGRTGKYQDAISLFWTGSGLECNVQGSELWMEVEADYETHEPWMSVIINGAYVSRMMLNKGKTWICLFRGMNGEKVKNVRVVKEVQAMPEDEKHCMLIHALKTDGKFLPVEDKKYRLEFIGDSITSGEGSMGATIEEDWISMWFSTQHTYVRTVAEQMEAEYRVLSQSGWGVYTSFDNNPRCVIPPYYEEVCGVVRGEKNRCLGAFEKNDFSAWQPDAIVINLGTNDGIAFDTPMWHDEVTGESHKQRRNTDGTYNEADLKKLEEAVTAFLLKVRKCNKEAQILWVYGLLGYSMLPTIKAGVEAYQKLTDDGKVTFLELPETTNDTLGARQHPGKLAHIKAGKAICDVLNKLLK